MTGFGSPANSWSIAMLEGALDLVCMGIALTRRSGEVMYANESSRRFLVAHSLATPAPVAEGKNRQYRLRGHLAKIVQEIDATRTVWSTPNGHLLVEILPLGVATDVLGMLGRRGGAMLMMQERGKHQFPTIKQLKDFFGLTAAEARTCLTLCQVESAEKCADRLNVSVATVRSQLQAAMHKTSTSKQAELLSVVLSVPACRADSDKVL